MTCTDILPPFRPCCYANELEEMGFTYRHTYDPKSDDRFCFFVTKRKEQIAFHTGILPTPRNVQYELVDYICFKIVGVADIDKCISEAIKYIKENDIKQVDRIPK